MRDKIWLGFLIAFILAIVLDMFIGWPSTLLVGVVVGLFYRKSRQAFIVAFVGTGFAWILMAMVPALWSPNWLMAAKLIQITGLSSGYGILMFLLTGIVGGLLAGLGAANTVIISTLISKKEKFSWE